MFWHAAGLAAVVTPEVAGANLSLAAAQHRLQARCAALASVEGFLHGSVTAALAAAVVQVGKDASGEPEPTNAECITLQQKAP